MKYNANINMQSLPPKDKESGWYAVKHHDKKYNRFLYVRSATEVIVLSDDIESVQLYTLAKAKELYKDWQPVNEMKIEVS
jgi:hypothetical protein